MEIITWGARGSIPTPGQATLKYGGNSTCIELRPDSGGIIIVDAGSGIRLLGKKLLKEGAITEINLVLTHSHWDHLMGFPFFMPTYFSKYRINLHGGPKAQGYLQTFFSHQMTPPYFPVEFSHLKAQFAFTPKFSDRNTICSVEFIPIPLNHPNGGYGFKFIENGKTFVFLTDNELDFAHPGGLKCEEYVSFCQDADLLFHDAQYTNDEYKTTRGWGHSTYEQAVNLAIAANVKRLGLFHHDPERSDEDLDNQLVICQENIQKAGAKVDCFGALEAQKTSL